MVSDEDVSGSKDEVSISAKGVSVSYDEVTVLVLDCKVSDCKIFTLVSDEAVWAVSDLTIFNLSLDQLINWETWNKLSSLFSSAS